MNSQIRASYQQMGIILITTVLLIAVVSLLILSQMQLVFLDYKALNQLAERHDSFIQLEREAEKLASLVDFSMPGHCTLKASDPNKVIQLLKDKRGCVLTHKKQRLYYLLENLGPFPCWQTQVNGIAYSTQHQRISILSFAPYLMILQLRIAKLSKLEICKQDEIISAKLGLLSWRHLSSGVI